MAHVTPLRPDLRTMLDKFCVTNGFKSAILVGPGAITLTASTTLSEWPAVAEHAAALAACHLTLARESSGLFDYGNVDQILITNSRGYLAIVGDAVGHSLVIAADNTTNRAMLATHLATFWAELYPLVVSPPQQHRAGGH